MKIPDIDPALLGAARDGNASALDSLLVQIQPGVFNLCMRMLGHREDAKDACQEILIKVITHLSTFRGEAAWSTWVHSVARNHLLTAATRQRESPEASFAELKDKLAKGWRIAEPTWAGRSISPEDKLAARQIAIGCTQGMLMCLDREQRLVYVLDVVFGLTSEVAAAVLGITAVAYRKRLSRARRTLDGFVQQSCSLVNASAACSCEKQAHAVRVQGKSAIQAPTPTLPDRDATASFDDLVAMSDAAAVFRSQPAYSVPEVVVQTIRAVLTANGYMSAVDQPPTALN